MNIKDYLYSLKGKLITLVIFLIVLISLFYFYKYYKNMNKKEDSLIAVVTKDEEKEKEKESAAEERVFYVDIKGKVSKAGVYRVKEGQRVIDVIDLAGGLLKDADTSLINLSMPIKDAMVIIVYSKDEVKNIEKTLAKEEAKQSLCQEAIINDACIKEESKEIAEDLIPGKININTASLSELMSLSGIGEAKAKMIIEYREVKLFESIEQLKEVSGIGEAVFAQIQENITI